MHRDTRIHLGLLVGICIAGGLALAGQWNLKIHAVIDLGWYALLGAILLAGVWTWVHERRARKSNVAAPASTVRKEAKPRLNRESLKDFLIAFAVMFAGFAILLVAYRMAVHEPTVLQPRAPWILLAAGLGAFGIAVGVALPLILRIGTRAAAATIRDMSLRENHTA